MALQKVVNGVYIDLTEAEIAQRAADMEAHDLDMNHVRGQRDGQLRGSDWTQLGDAPFTDEQKAEWVTYRQELRDLPANFDRVSEVVWPEAP